jgi:pimeloyl-ACP methyl ester carboxylesterase
MWLSKRLLALLLVPVAVIAVPAAAQQGPNIAGDWHGAVTVPQGDLTLVLHVERPEEGALKATVESFDQNPGSPMDVTEITQTGSHLSWKVSSINATYEGDWDDAAKAWKGTFRQGADLALNLVQGRPANRPVIAGLDGVWLGTIERNGVKLRQVLNIRTVPQGTFALYSSPDQLANGLPVTGLGRDGQNVTLTTGRGQAKFAAVLSADGNELTGTWTVPNQPDAAMTFTKATEEVIAARRNPARPQTPKAPFPYQAEEVAFANPAFADVHLAGTLTLPSGAGPFPAAIMITGSGGQERDETLLDHKPFAVIADHLTRHGIAVLRFDDRGVGKSKGDYGAATTADLATDANAAFAFLAGRPDIRPDAIGFIGHSEGGMIAPIAMAANPGVAYLVSLAGPGTNLIQLLLSQRRLLATQMGVTSAELDKQEPVMRALFEAMANGATPEAGHAAAMAVMTPDAKLAMGMPVEMDAALLVNQVSGAWFQYFMKYDPVPFWLRISVPVLALNGSLDLQVPAAENLPAIRAALKDNPDATLVELPGLNHLFQTARTGAIGEYRDIEETIAPVALDTMTEWITKRFGRGS